MKQIETWRDLVEYMCPGFVYDINDFEKQFPGSTIKEIYQAILAAGHNIEKIDYRYRLTPVGALLSIKLTDSKWN